MTDREHEFWTIGSEYEDLARRFECNIEETHPDSVTSRRMCACLEYFAYCGWGASSVTYYEYRGDAIT